MVVELRTATDLHVIREGLDRDYRLVEDIEIDEKFQPIGSSVKPFTGTLNGNGHVIENLRLDEHEQNHVGLFGYTKGAEIRNLGLVDVDVHGSTVVGGLIGHASSTTVSQVFVTGNVAGIRMIGGIVGRMSNSTLTQSYAVGTVTGTRCVGGLVGKGKFGRIHTAYATSKVIGDHRVAGIIGVNGIVNNMVSNVVADCFIDARKTTSGLIAYQNNGTIENSYYVDDGIHSAVETEWGEMEHVEDSPTVLSDSWTVVDGIPLLSAFDTEQQLAYRE